MSPAMAATAAIVGKLADVREHVVASPVLGKASPMRCVRPWAPWRPSKLRLEVLAQRSLGDRISGFIPRKVVNGRKVASNIKRAMIVPGSGLVKEQAESEGLDLGRQDIRVHTQAHRAASLTPFETGISEDLVETLGG
jgi:hypothetical protein